MTRSFYLAWLLVLGLLPTGLSWVLNPSADSTLVNTGLLAVGAIVLTVFRLRNIGHPWWLALFVIVPILGEIFILWCLIVPPGFERTGKFDLAGKIATMPAALAGLLLLAVFLFPGMGGGLSQGKKTQARNDAAQISLAINAYLNEYGTLPTTSKTDVVAMTDNSAVMEILSPPTAHPTALNSRGINFIEIPNSTTGRNGRLNGAGSFLDPWGDAYLISLDGDGDGMLQNPLDPQGTGKIQKRVLIWSKGDPAKPADYNNPAKWLKSWE